MANGEVLDTLSSGAEEWQLIRFLDEVSAAADSDWLEAHIFRDGTLDVKTSGSPTFSISVQGCNDDGKPSINYIGPNLISAITAIGIYDLAKLPVRWIRVKTTYSGSGTISVNGNLCT